MEARQNSRIIKPPRKRSDLKIWMDGLLGEFNRSSYLETDPIRFVHDYDSNRDREIIALIAALFSFGNVRSIQSTLKTILEPLGKNPYETLLKMDDADIQRHWAHSYYRFYNSKDIQTLFRRLRDLIEEHSSLEAFFISQAQNDSMRGLSAYRDWFFSKNKITPGLRFMFADPMASSSKRWHMWLRWLVRKDEIDLGLWNALTPAQLILPLDTHVFDMLRYVGLIKSKTPSRNAAIEATAKLREWDPLDPVKYDFALCRLGVLGYKKQFISSRSQ